MRDALRIRGSRSEGRPARTVRYITAAAFVVMFAAILVFTGGIGTDNTASADTYEVSVDSADIVIYDSSGVVMDTPCTVTGQQPLLFSVSCESAVGTVSDGAAYPLSAICTDAGNGLYSISLKSDLVLTEIREVEQPAEGLVLSVYDFGRTVSDGYAASFDGYISSDEYIAETGGLWASDGAFVRISAADGSYVSSGEDAGVFLASITSSAWSVPDVSAAVLPDDCARVELRGAAFEVTGFYASGEVMVEKDRDVSMRLVSTEGPVRVYLDDGASGVRDVAFGNSVGTVTFSVDRDSSLVCEPIGIY